MLATKLRFTQAQDPTGVAGAPCGVTTTGPVTVPGYQVTTAARPSSATRPAASRLGSAITGNWTVIEGGAMPKVDFHDRWPLHSTS